MKNEELFKINLQMFADGEDDEKDEDVEADTEDEKDAEPEKVETKPKKTKKESIDVEAIKAEIRKQIMEELKQKAKEEKDAEFIKDVKQKIEKKENDNKETDKDILISSLTTERNELKEALKIMTDKFDNEAKEKQHEKIKNEIRQRVKKEPYLEEIVTELLDKGRINSMEDYDTIITASLRKSLKDAFELKEKAKKMGADPAEDYTDNKKSNTKTDWKKAAAEKYADEVKKKLGQK